MIGKKVENTRLTTCDISLAASSVERIVFLRSTSIQVSCGFWVSGVFCEAIHKNWSLSLIETCFTLFLFVQGQLRAERKEFEDNIL